MHHRSCDKVCDTRAPVTTTEVEIASRGRVCSVTAEVAFKPQYTARGCMSHLQVCTIHTEEQCTVLDVPAKPGRKKTCTATKVDSGFRWSLGEQAQNRRKLQKEERIVRAKDSSAGLT